MDLAHGLGELPVNGDPRVITDFRDAGVFRIDGDRALVQSMDFFTLEKTGPPRVRAVRG